MLYPAPLRDLLLSLADHELYTPKWSEIIQEEWSRNVLINRKDLKKVQINRTAQFMNEAFPDAQVVGFESLIIGLELPDPNDNHVLAAAIRCNAEVIVTSNMKDFPQDYLNQFDIEAQDPDSFVSNIIDLDQKASLIALKEQASRLKNPPRTVNDILVTLEQNGLVDSVRAVMD